MNKWLYRVLMVLLLGVLLFSGYHLGSELMQIHRSTSLGQALVEGAVESHAAPQQTGQDSQSLVPIHVDFDVLRQQAPDAIGWLYCPDTPIHYPVVQGKDNQFYLTHLADGTANCNGALFADHKSAPDFSQWNTFVYGHNMRSGNVLGTLPKYSQQEYYDQHPLLWLLTPQQDFLAEPAAGCVVTVDTPLYTLPATGEQAAELVRQAMAQSTFAAELEPSDQDHWLTLSTCTNRADDERYLLIFRLTPVD